MKIYFEDGELIDAIQFDIGATHRIDAKYGYLQNEKAFDAYNTYYNGRSIAIYTNSLVGLSNKYCWNSELEVPELYIRPYAGRKDFVRVDKLTKRVLREGHNLMKMYIAGEFGNFS